jgi:hypothetical protein
MGGVRIDYAKTLDRATLDDQDLEVIKGLIEVTLDEKMSHLLTKDEFSGKTDEVMGELQNNPGRANSNKPAGFRSRRPY